MATKVSTNGTVDAPVVEAQVVHDFDALLDEVRAGDEAPALIKFTVQKGTAKEQDFTIPSPLDWPDEVLRLQQAAAMENTAAMVSLAEELLGDQYSEFRAAGGSALRLWRVLPKMLGLSVGESSAS